MVLIYDLKNVFNNLYTQRYTLQNIFNEILKSPQMPENTGWKRKNFQLNDVVVKEGDPGNTLFFVEKGELRVSGSVNLGAKKHIQPGIADLKEGAIFGESCLLQSLPRIATVTAVTEASLLEINGEQLSIYLDDNPIQGYLFYKQLFETMIKRLNSANHTVESLMAWGLKAHEIDQHL